MAVDDGEAETDNPHSPDRSRDGVEGLGRPQPAIRLTNATIDAIRVVLRCDALWTLSMDAPISGVFDLAAPWLGNDDGSAPVDYTPCNLNPFWYVVHVARFEACAAYPIECA
jgi:hypothetical protein